MLLWVSQPCFLLYLIRFSLTKAAERFPQRRRIIFFVNTMRTVVVILLYTLISWLVNMHRRDDPAFKVLGKIPKGENCQTSKIHRLFN